MRLLVVVPAFDEAGSLPALVAELREAVPVADVLVVDDGSTDETPALLPRLGVAWLRFCDRLGTGSAVRAGLRWSRGRGYATVARLDADGQHRPADLPLLLDPLAAGTADAVVGSRYLEPAGYRARGRRRLAQRALGVSLRAIVGHPVSDPTSGFWAFGPRAALLLARRHPGGYPEPELHLLLHRGRLRVAEVPIVMRERSAGRSSLTASRELVALGRTLLALALVPLRDRAELDGDLAESRR